MHEKRRQLLPMAGRIPLSRVLSAAEEYWRVTGREITFEYVLLGGLNCAAADAEQLALRLAGLRANVNVIPFNGVAASPFEAPTEEEIESFVRTLESRGLNVNVRRRRRADIDAACGQLRERHADG